MLDDLKEAVCAANVALGPSGLVTLTWGNVSGIDRPSGRVVIKPSGVPYEKLEPRHMVVLDLGGEVVEGDLRPSSDTPTHLALYRAFQGIGGVAHTHSPCAVMFCQAGRQIPCFGTTHADHFMGAVPLARALTPSEVEKDYEGHTGSVIVEHFRRAGLDPLEMPAVLLAHHGPFTWGTTAAKAMENSVALEAVANMALGTLQLAPETAAIPAHILDKHYRRKHGPGAYYGQR